MIISDMEIRIRADIAQLQAALNAARSAVSDTASGISRSADQMNKALSSIGLDMGLSRLVEMSDQYTRFTAKLRLASSSQREYGQALDDVKRISAQAQSSMADVGTLYGRIANGVRDLGATQAQVAGITEAVSLSIKVSGATAEEASSAMQELAKSFASGKLGGEEFNAVNDAAPRLMMALADGMGVPIDTLKNMAENGEITSKVMAEALPTALSKLREESQQIQTISGAFQVLKDRAMEYTAVHAEANGTVAILTQGIGLLANNFSILMEVMGTLTMAKLGASLSAWTVDTYKQASAALALRAANIALLESELASSGAKVAQLTATEAAIVAERELVVGKLAAVRANIVSAEAAISAAGAAGAQSFALRTLQLATAELAVAEVQRAAMMTELAVLGRQQTSVSAQLAAAKTAEATAQAGVNAATGAGTVAAGLFSRAIGFLGGPVGAIITLLGLAAMAWSHWGSAAKGAADQAKTAEEDSFTSVIKSLDAQIEKHEAIIRLRKQGMSLDDARKVDQKPVNELAALSSKLSVLNAGPRPSGMSNDDVIFERVRIMEKIGQLTTKMMKEQSKGAEATGLTQAEARVKFMADYATKAEQLATKLAEGRKLLGAAFTPADEARVRAAFEDKGAATPDKAAPTNLDKTKSDVEHAKVLRAEELAQITEMNRQGIESDAQLYAAKHAAALAAGTDAAKIMDAQIAELQKYHGKDAEAQRTNAKEIEKIELEKTETLRASLVAADLLQKQYVFDSGKPERDAQGAVDAQIAAANAESVALQAQYDNYAKLPEQITAATIAKLEARTVALETAGAYEWEIAKNNQLIAALKNKAAWQSKVTTQDTGSDVAKAKELLDVLTAVDTATKSAATSMAASFGRVGGAIGSLATALSGYAVQQQTIAAQLESTKADPKSSADKIARAEIAASQASAQAKVKSYGDMAGAAKGFFKENSAGYKVMQVTEQAFRAAEMAMAIESMVKKVFFKEAEVAANVALNGTKLAGEATTTAASTGLAATEASAWGITAVVKALASLPFPANLAAGAATLAAVVAIGAKMFGGGGGSGGGQSAADVQKAQGTGSVFGDSAAKSDSIRGAIEVLQKNSDLLIPINKGMLTSLQAIEASMMGITNLVVRTTGLTEGTNMGIQEGTIGKSTGASIASGAAAGAATGAAVGSVVPVIGTAIGAAFGAVVGGIIGGLKSIWGKTTQTIVDSGLQYGGTMRNLEAGTGFNQYASVDTTKSSWFGLSKSTSNSVQTQGLNDELSTQFGLIFKNLDSSLQAAAVAMGGSADDVAKVLNDLTLASTKVSLKGLTGTALTDALNAVISKSMDEITAAVFPQFESFRQVGEGYAETVMRLAGDYLKLDSILAASSSTFGATGIASIAAREHLIELAGGIDSLASQTSTFTENFLSKAEQLAPVQKYVTEQLAAMGLQSLDTRDKFKNYLLGLTANGALLDTTAAVTAAGQQQYLALLALADAFAQTHAATVDLSKSQQEIADEAKDLQNQYDELTMNSAQLLAKERAAIADTNLALFDQVHALSALKDAQASYDSAASSATSALQTAASQYKSFVDAVTTTAKALVDAQQAIRNEYDKALAADTTARTAVKTEQEKITDGYIAASQKVEAAQAKIADGFYKLGQTIDTFLDSLDTTDVGGLPKDAQLANLQASLTVTAARARAGDTNAGGQLPEIAKNLLALGRDTTATQVDYLRLVAGVRATLSGVAVAAARQGASSETTPADELDAALAQQKQWADAVTASGASFTKAAAATTMVGNTIIQSSADLLAGYQKALAAQADTGVALKYWAQVAAGTGVSLADTKTALATAGDGLIKALFDAQLNAATAEANLAAANAIRNGLELRQVDALETFVGTIKDVNTTGKAASEAAAALFTAASNELVAGSTAALSAQEAAKAGMIYWGDIVTTTARGIAASVQAMAAAADAIAAAQAASSAAAAAASNAASADEKMVRSWYANNSQYASNGHAPTNTEVNYWLAALQMMSATEAKTAFALAAARDAGFSKPLEISAFADGGDHQGGLRLVGENGPELEVTGPSRIFNTVQTYDLLSGGKNDNTALLEELRSLRQEVAALRTEQRAGDAANVAATKAQTSLLRDVTDNGTAILTIPAVI